MSSPLRSLVDWLDNRTGVRGLLHEALYERVPGGARWRYVWGSTLVIAFVCSDDHWHVSLDGLQPEHSDRLGKRVLYSI